ncbi:Amino acid/polyamine transporter I [Akanthomyces lecanii RCEF 1005]|uniref:Amino acid/polyamine transporter I n=1 Tax=Akanthomyces lecanii RCEF 1005 TaxID=1081108 RepID=A0A168KF07_CORDF|nr:Amino acid/polyamine transporter I [Akanthomyces lecanii RCEF 1005]
MATDDKGLDANVYAEGVDEKNGNAGDRLDMYRMGKAQEMRRNFRFLSILGFSMILMASWEFSLSVATIGLVNGGTAGLIWMFFVCWMGFFVVNTSMAEMASMAPTSGGQYHWVSEFAPPKHQKLFSYLIGWMCVLGWQTSCASSAFIAGTQIQGLIVLNYPGYQPQAWHGTLLTIAVAAFSVLFNTLLARKLPLIEALVLVIHVFGFFGILVTLWVLSPRGDAKTVFTEFNDGGEWGSFGGSALVGILAGILPLLGADAAVHMSEELRDASRTLPRSMIMTTIFNGAFGWIMVITLCFCIGGDLESVTKSPTGFPFMAVFLNSTGSAKSATAMSVFIVAMTIFSNLTMVATASRQLFAFARDRAVPLSPWFANVPAGWDVPINSILTTFLITSLLSLINIGSTAALNSITSLATTSILSSYIVSIGCMIWRRWTNSPLLSSKFSLGRWGLAVNIASEAFLVVIFILAFMPPNPNPSAEEMNWNIVIYGGIAIFSVIYYLFRGRHQYEGPVVYVRALQPETAAP